MRKAVIAVDGPAGSGKSTVSRILAERVGFVNYNSGNTFRALTWILLKHGVSLSDVDADDESRAIHSVLERIAFDRGGVDGRRDCADMDLLWTDGLSVWVNGADITGDLTSDAVKENVFKVAKALVIRKKATSILRDFARNATTGMVVEGRDIGSLVFPDADMKIFLTASKDERARRRSNQYNEQLEKVSEDIERRDYEDTHRKYGALRRAEGAVEVDTTNMSLEEVVDLLIGMVAKVTGEKAHHNGGAATSSGGQAHADDSM